MADSARTVADRVDGHLAFIYRDLDETQRRDLGRRLLNAVGVDGEQMHRLDPVLPDEQEVMLITYGDTVIDGDAPGLRALSALLDGPFAGIFSAVHVLPFFESSSDGGFAIVDYRSLAPEVGEWSDLSGLSAGRELMVDLVCNHGSAQSAWFQAFRRDEAPYREWYVTADREADVSTVVRPRTHNLLMPVETASGVRHVWATFSHDQVDFDFANPEVLVEFSSIIGEYLDRGASRIRLDAIAYLWKQLGTPCIHLPETHEVVKLFRTLTSAREEPALLVTETNVPHAQNVSYFGDGDEAHIVYNFTLAPLIAWTVLSERAEQMTGWLGRLGNAPEGCAFLNFLASHDGIGLRPIEDLISDDELSVLLERAREIGGAWSSYSAPGGPRPYELNVSLADLLAGSDGEHADRFVAAHALLLALQGIPAIYVHSMLSTPSDHTAVAASGHLRDINRSRLNRSLVDERLAGGWRRDVFERLAALIRIRRRQPAFAPTADQIVHVLDRRVISIERRCTSQRLFAIHNVSSDHVSIELPDWVGIDDLLDSSSIDERHPVVTLAPWQVCWLVDPEQP